MKATFATRTNAQWLAELRQHAQQGEAIEELRTYLRKALARTLRGRASIDESDLDDFTQDALMRILQKLDRFRGDSRFTTWATAVAVRVALSAQRRRRYQYQPLEELELGTVKLPAGVSSEGHDPGHVIQHKTLLEALQQAIRETLTERQRIAILGELAGVPSAVLVERLGTNSNALYKLHHDARKKLKRAINDAGFSDQDVRQELLMASETA